MQKKLKGFYLLLISFLVCFIYLPFAFGKKNAYTLKPIPTTDKTFTRSTDSVALISVHRSIYDSLHLEISGLSKKAFDMAQKGFYKIEHQGRLSNDSLLSIIDFSQSSDKKRLYVLDMKNYKILYNTLVAHGRNSGKLWAQSFSNRPSSYKSSLGFYITRQTYDGNNGYSLKLEGLERGFNNNAGRRAIVLHGAGYVCDSYINDQGYIGRSEGCPAVPQQFATEIINTIKDGTCLFIYHPNKLYSQRSLLAKG